jgi:hypothetical protein
MNINKNHERAERIVDSWPEWKKEVILTRHSNESLSGQKAYGQTAQSSNRDQETKNK